MDRPFALRVEEIFVEALDLSPADRDEFVVAACGGDEEMRREVGTLLAAAARSQEYFTKLPQRLRVAALLNRASESASAADEDSCAVGASGERYGQYTLIKRIGSGGMGAVWLAERTDGMIKRPVALKLPHVTSRHAGLAERMAREREILATLDHPHIGRLYDAGLGADNQPFLALEYVEGRPIDEYCRAHALDLRARLALFVKITDAASYAHGKLVIHRDLKPANILVTEEGRAVLLDFGIAKLIGEQAAGESHLTEITGRALTLDYASPEQINGAPLTVATDVYSLGVVLFELLTDTRPYKLKRDTRGALEEAILDVEPPRPSDIVDPAKRRVLRGDLDTIVLKALKKNPEQRYATAHALSDDVRRYLEHRPVLAQPDRRWYRVGKFVVRNRYAVSAASAVLLAIVIGAGAAFWQARLARAEQERAEQVKDFMVSIFQDANPYGALGRAVSASDLLNEARGAIQDRFENRPDLRLELLGTVGMSLSGLGDLSNAEAALEQALAEATQLFGPQHLQTIRLRVLLTDISSSRRDVDTLRRELEELLPVVRRTARADPELLVRLLKNQANLAFELGRRVEAEGPAREAFEIGTRELGMHHPLTVAASSLIAETYLAEGRDVDAMLAESQRALQLALDAHQGRETHATVIRMREVRGRALAVSGRFQEAVMEMRAALETVQQVLGPSSMAAAIAMVNLAPYERRLGDIDAALRGSNAALAIFEERIQKESADYAYALVTRGLAFIAARRPQEALADLIEAEEISTRMFGAAHWETLTARFNRAIALAYLQRIDAARAALAPADDPATPIANAMWVAHVKGIVDRLAGEFQSAISHQRQAEHLIAAGPRADWDRVRVLSERGLAEIAAGNIEDARATIPRARDLYVKLGVSMHPAYAEVLDALATIDAQAQ